MENITQEEIDAYFAWYDGKPKITNEVGAFVAGRRSIQQEWKDAAIRASESNYSQLAAIDPELHKALTEVLERAKVLR